MRCLNLGCGIRFHPEWTNIDFYSNSPHIITYDLTKRLSFDNNSFDVVYHSHVLEHFTKSQANFFLQECYRVLRPGGVIRVAVPDLEQICRLYLEALDKAEKGDRSWQANYEWLMLELYDQCVRTYSGGDMLRYLLQKQIPNENFLAARFGSFYKILAGWVSGLKKDSEECSEIAKRETWDDKKIGEFRRSGEIHQWMYDRYSLKTLLQAAGFKSIVQQNPVSSYISEWYQYNLDTDSDGTQYKADSLYMEGIK